MSTTLPTLLVDSACSNAINLLNDQFTMLFTKRIRGFLESSSNHDLFTQLDTSDPNRLAAAIQSGAIEATDEYGRPLGGEHGLVILGREQI